MKEVAALAGMQKIISVRFSSSEKSMLESYAKLHGKKQSDILREAAMRMIEDDQDFRLLEEAKRKTTRYYSLKEAREELELDSPTI
jgi:predicted DNA-binding protein